MKKGNGVVTEVKVPLTDLKRKIASYHALLEDGKIQDLSNEEMDDFRKEVNFYYGEIDKEERENANRVKEDFKPHNRFVIL